MLLPEAVVQVCVLMYCLFFPGDENPSMPQGDENPSMPQSMKCSCMSIAARLLMLSILGMWLCCVSCSLSYLVLGVEVGSGSLEFPQYADACLAGWIWSVMRHTLVC
jgi:hypothetical protein